MWTPQNPALAVLYSGQSLILQGFSVITGILGHSYMGHRIENLNPNEKYLKVAVP